MFMSAVPPFSPLSFISRSTPKEKESATKNSMPLSVHFLCVVLSQPIGLVSCHSLPASPPPATSTKSISAVPGELPLMANCASFIDAASMLLDTVHSCSSPTPMFMSAVPPFSPLSFISRSTPKEKESPAEALPTSNMDSLGAPISNPMSAVISFLVSKFSKVRSRCLVAECVIVFPFLFRLANRIR